MLIAAIPNMEKIHVLSSLPGITRHWNLQLTLMQVLSGGIFNLCLPPFTFFQPQSSLQTIWCDSTVCWTPIFCDKCNDKYTHSIESVPLWKLGHTWCICVINANATWALFLGNITFFFFACVSLHSVLIALCPYLPLNSVMLRDTSPKLKLLSMTLFLLRLSGIPMLWKLIIFSHLPLHSQSLSFYPASSSPCHLPLTSWTSLPLSQHEAWTVIEASLQLPAPCSHHGKLSFFLLYFLMKNWLLTFLGGRRRKHSKRVVERKWALFKLVIIILWYLCGILGVIMLLMSLLSFPFGFGLPY